MWWKGDDRLDEHPKALALIDRSPDPAAAFGLWLFVQCLAARQATTEGRLTLAEVRGQGRKLGMSKKRIDQAVGDLLEGKFWSQDGAMIVINDWMDYNQILTNIIAQREASRVRSAAYRARLKSKNHAT
jgi:hypothetical protein